MALKRINDHKVDKQLVPPAIGLAVLAIGISFGYNAGYAVNPARDLAPRIFTGLFSIFLLSIQNKMCVRRVMID